MTWNFIHERFVERFWRQVRRDAECWEWAGMRYRHGYGRVSKNGARVKAHRVSWELANGPIPRGMGVLHRCDNPPCVNPAHLFLGTQQDNMDDMVSKGRLIRGSRRPTSKLGEVVVPTIRGLYGIGFTQSELGAMYGVSSVTIHKVVTRKYYSHTR